VKLFFGEKEILIPIYKNFESLPVDDTITTLLNFASFRSATESTWEALKTGRFHTIVIVAEGIPERDIREMIAWNNARKESEKTLIIGPATAGAIV
jgi:succinyl-CoA synthetase alpha subunit